MIYEITKELAAAVHAKGFPYQIVFGPERTAPLNPTRVVVDHAGQGSDKFAAPKSVHANPTMRMLRLQGVVMKIYAQSTVIGAAVQDHRRLAEHMLDMLVCELDVIIKNRKNEWVLGSGGFLLPTDLAPSEVWPGAVYGLSFAVSRGMSRRTWAGDARPTVAVGSGLIKNTTKVSTASASDSPFGTPPGDAEIGCGGS